MHWKKIEEELLRLEYAYKEMLKMNKLSGMSS